MMERSAAEALPAYGSVAGVAGARKLLPMSPCTYHWRFNTVTREIAALGLRFQVAFVLFLLVIGPSLPALRAVADDVSEPNRLWRIRSEPGGTLPEVHGGHFVEGGRNLFGTGTGSQARVTSLRRPRLCHPVRLKSRSCFPALNQAGP
jgi:hypothetical protein